VRTEGQNDRTTERQQASQYIPRSLRSLGGYNNMTNISTKQLRISHRNLLRFILASRLLKIGALLFGYKKLCRCRGTARRATNTKYRTWKGLQ